MTMTRAQWTAFRALYPKAEHYRRAIAMQTDARAAMRRYDALVNDAMQTYGKPDGWPARWTSGIIGDHFPEQVKDDIRRALRATYAMRDTADLHWKAAGKRKTMVHAPGKYYGRAKA